MHHLYGYDLYADISKRKGSRQRTNKVVGDFVRLPYLTQRHPVIRNIYRD